MYSRRWCGVTLFGEPDGAALLAAGCCLLGL